jgi:hypothetical protein
VFDSTWPVWVDSKWGTVAPGPRINAPGLLSEWPYRPCGAPARRRRDPIAPHNRRGHASPDSRVEPLPIPSSTCPPPQIPFSPVPPAPLKRPPPPRAVSRLPVLPPLRWPSDRVPPQEFANSRSRHHRESLLRWAPPMSSLCLYFCGHLTPTPLSCSRQAPRASSPAVENGHCHWSIIAPPVFVASTPPRRLGEPSLPRGYSAHPSPPLVLKPPGSPLLGHRRAPSSHATAPATGAMTTLPARAERRLAGLVWVTLDCKLGQEPKLLHPIGLL